MEGADPLRFLGCDCSDQKGGQQGKARTAGLHRAVLELRNRQERLGRDAVRLGWVKAHIGIPGNERADQLAEEGAEDGPRHHGGGVKTGMEERRYWYERVI